MTAFGTESRYEAREITATEWHVIDTQAPAHEDVAVAILAANLPGYDIPAYARRTAAEYNEAYAMWSDRS